MSYSFHDSKFGNIKWRETPWDKNVFGVQTIEILDLNCKSVDDGRKLLQDFQKKNEVALLYGRFDATNQEIKKIFLMDGFFQCETAIKLRKNKLSLYELPEFIRGREPKLEQAIKTEDIDYIVGNSHNMYHFSRFHEDPFIDRNHANKRMGNWVRQLIENDTPILCHREKSGEIISYLFYKENNNEAELILGGSLPGKGLYSPYFYGGAIQYFKLKGLKALTASVSAANKGMLSLKILLGFNVTSIHADYHKHNNRK